MEEPEYVPKGVPNNTQDIRKQLNDMHKSGYDFVAVAMNHVIYKKSKKPKKD